MNRQLTSPIAQDFTIVHQHGLDWRNDGPSLLRLPSGRLVASFVVLNSARAMDLNATGPYTVISVSDDQGQTWQEKAQLSYELALLFPGQDGIYLLGVEAGRGNLVITVSRDAGENWREPVSLIQGKFWNTSTGSVIKDGRLYWCVGACNEQGEWNSKGSRTAALCADLRMDLLQPEAWRISAYLAYPGTPAALRAGICDKPDKPYADHWLEGNVAIKEDDQALRVYWRVRIDGQTTPGICAVCDLKDDGQTLDYRFKMFYPLPGAQNHFHIIKDPQSQAYFMTSNLPTRSQDWEYGFGRGLKSGERRILLLSCSFDGLDWLPLRYLVIWPKLRQSSNYSTPVIDGDDLLVISRTSRDALNQHDNDLITLHRVQHFRDMIQPLVLESRT